MASYAWYADGVAINGATGASLAITADMKGKKIKVVVTDAAGKTFESAESEAVKEDVAANVTISDVFGLQTNGTGLKGDILQLSYGSEVGTPNSITWYRDNAIIATYTDKAASYTNANGLRLPAANVNKTGKYWVVITTADGKQVKSNEIEIGDVEDPAVIKSFTIEDDYETGVDSNNGATKLDFNAMDGQAVATLVINRQYEGRIRIYAETDTKLANAIGARLKNTADTTTGAGFTWEDTENKMAVKDVSGTATTLAKAFQAEDGTTTYKWVIGNAAANGVTRGTSYIAVFDQTNISTDDINKGKENKSEAFKAPFVKMPESIAITKVAAGAPAEVTAYETGTTVTSWMGGAAGVASATAVTFKVFEDDSNAVSTASTTVQQAGATKKGVATMGGNIAKSYFIATATFDKTVYGGDTNPVLTSEKIGAAEAGVVGLKVSNDPVKAPKDIKVAAGTSFKTAGKVALYRHTDATKWTANPIDVSTNTVKIGEKDVVKGDPSVTFEGVATQIYSSATEITAGNTGKDEYVAVFTPSDTLAFTAVTSQYNANAALTEVATITAQVVGYKLTAAGKADITLNGVTAVDTAGAIVGVDQFGTEISTGLVALNAADMTAAKACTGTASVPAAAGKLLVVFDADGKVTITAEAADYTATNYLDVDLPGGQKLKVTVKDTTTNGTSKVSLSIPS